MTGSRHPKRWQDVEELREAGIEVWTTMNVQHLESLSEAVARITGVRVAETVPDRVLAEADAVELIDIPPAELIERMGDLKGLSRFSLFIQLLDLLVNTDEFELLSSPEFAPELEAQSLDVLRGALAFIYENIATDIHLADLPPELRQQPVITAAPVTPAKAGIPSSDPAPSHDAWPNLLRQWAELKLRAGQNDLLGEALPEFERTLIRIALAECGGQRQEAARRLGWGRNTLTRKIKELGLGDL